ncbi:hypothetical protein B0T16DRAFT_192415 [Cercophora newfieldiana]|uniref:Secreted protein n=1 Tax=Cercophora newfieldiana TaxID=92897 RepID=A0AA39Y1I9_9PEZI|nr:hypothetical protein B0T16DRAFT_192415 [Cercophora newfieldiana]
MARLCWFAMSFPKCCCLFDTANGYQRRVRSQAISCGQCLAILRSGNRLTPNTHQLTSRRESLRIKQSSPHKTHSGLRKAHRPNRGLSDRISKEKGKEKNFRWGIEVQWPEAVLGCLSSGRQAPPLLVRFRVARLSS